MSIHALVKFVTKIVPVRNCLNMNICCSEEKWLISKSDYYPKGWDVAKVGWGVSVLGRSVV